MSTLLWKDVTGSTHIMARKAVFSGNMSPQSDMSTPTEQFAGLSIDATMPPSPTEVRRRALILQDILSSFDEQELPFEFRASMISDIDRPPRERPDREEYFIRQDLSGTILNWGAYDDNFWKSIERWRRPKSQAVIFSEKLGRRFNHEFEAYDEIPETEPARTVKDISTQLTYLSRAAQRDTEYWIDLDEEAMLDREERTCLVLLDALRNVCKRTVPKLTIPTQTPSRRTSRRTASSSSESQSLFDALIKMGSRDTEDLFMLPALQSMSGPTLKTHFQELLEISDLLDRLEAPIEYTQQFGALQEKAASDTEPISNRLPRAPEDVPEPKTGSKRTQPPSGDGQPRRGKRRGGK